MIALIGIFVITSSACCMQGLDINFSTKSTKTERFEKLDNSYPAYILNQFCPVCGERMKIKNYGSNCAVFHPDGECDWNKPYCPNENNHNKKLLSIETIEKFIRVSTSSAVSQNEIARPVCDWIGHHWMEIYNYESNYELNQCIYCDRKRIKKEVWEE